MLLCEVCPATVKICATGIFQDCAGVPKAGEDRVWRVHGPEPGQDGDEDLHRVHRHHAEIQWLHRAPS